MESLGGSGSQIGGTPIITSTGPGNAMMATWDLTGLYPPTYLVYARVDDTFDAPIASAPSAMSPQITPTPSAEGTISDPRNNGVGISGVTVRLDAAYNGRYVLGDPTTTVNATGFYPFCLTSSDTGFVGVIILSAPEAAGPGSATGPSCG